MASGVDGTTVWHVSLRPNAGARVWQSGYPKVGLLRDAVKLGTYDNSAEQKHPALSSIGKEVMEQPPQPCVQRRWS